MTLSIAHITEPLVLRYFETLNAGDFAATSQLFAADGVMYPPMAEAVVGREAIATYLHTEAKGVRAQPQQGTIDRLEAGYSEVQVNGVVQVMGFEVKAAWFFSLSAVPEIIAVRVKLLASAEELLNLQG